MLRSAFSRYVFDVCRGLAKKDRDKLGYVNFVDGSKFFHIFSDVSICRSRCFFCFFFFVTAEHRVKILDSLHKAGNILEHTQYL